MFGFDLFLHAAKTAMLGFASTDRQLAGLSKGTTGVVHGVREPASGDGAMERRLTELGFVSGERFEVLAEAWPSRDPVVVRVGSTTLALRRREAAAVAVKVDAPWHPLASAHAQSA